MDLGHVLITQTIFNFYYMIFNLFRFLKKPAIIVVKGEEVSYNEDLSFPTNFARSVSNMTKMPDHIAEQIKKTESYREEIESVSAASRELHMKALHLEMQPVRESWPHIYMLCKCVKPFTKSRYDEEFECDREYEVELGEEIIFEYDYTEGVFRESCSFSGKFSLFTYEDFSSNFEVIKYGNSINEVLS